MNDSKTNTFLTATFHQLKIKDAHTGLIGGIEILIYNKYPILELELIFDSQP